MPPKRRAKLAVEGGSPVRDRPLFYGRQSIDRSDERALVAALRSDFLTQGPTIERFEDAVAEYLGVKYAVAFANGTAALHGAYFALGLGPGDEIVTTPLTFAATANAALYLGAKVRFADIDPATGQVDFDALAAQVTRKTKLLAPVHFAGSMAPMDLILDLARAKGLHVVEDACHAFGATGYDGHAGTLGAIGVFSFHPVKPITSAEGGMGVTDDAGYAERMRQFRTHGIVKSPALARRGGPWYNEMQFLGYNYRLSDLHAALGLSQLERYPKLLRRRRRIAAQYDEAFAGMKGIRTLTIPDRVRPAYHLYPILVEPRAFRGGRRGFFEALAAEGVVGQVHYVPVNAHPYYRELGYDPADTPNAKRFYEREISLPIYPDMRDKDVHDVIAAVDKVRAALAR